MAGETTTTLGVTKPDQVHLDSVFETAASKASIELPWIKTLQLDITSLAVFNDVKFAAADGYELCNVYNMAAEGAQVEMTSPAPETLIMQQQMPQLNIA